MVRTRKHSIDTIHQICLDSMEGRGSYQSLSNNYMSQEKPFNCGIKHIRSMDKKLSSINQTVARILKSLKKKWFKSIFKEQELCLIQQSNHLSVSTIIKWIQVSYYGGEQNTYEPNGVVYTMKSRKTTTTERVEISIRMIDKEMNYKTTVQYHQVLK